MAQPPTPPAPPSDARAMPAPSPPPSAPPPYPPPPAAPPIGAALGAQAGVLLARLDPTGWRPTLIVAAVILGLVFGSVILNGILPSRAVPGPGPQPQPGRALDVGQGVRIYPEAGWVQGAGPGQLSLQKGAAVLDVFLVGGDQGDAGSLVQLYVDQALRPNASQLAVSAPQAVPIAAGAPGVRVTYVGNFGTASQAVEGQVTGIVLSGRQIVLDAWAPQGQLASLLQEMERMIMTVEVRP